MNFAMLDINSMLTSKEMGISLSCKKGAEGQAGMGDFVSRFEQAIKKHSKSYNFVSNGLSGSSNKLLQEDALKSKIDKLMSKVTNPIEFLQALEQIMAVIAKGNLENLKIDPQGLIILKEMLAGAGFSPDDLDEAFLKFSHPVGGKNISADKLFKKLGKLSPESNPFKTGKEASEDELVFAESMLPVIQSVLYSLGIEKNVADDIIKKASLKHQGTSLNQLIGQLKKLDQKTMDKIFQTPSGDASFTGLLEQMGVPFEKIKNSLENGTSISLNTLISSLEALRKSVLNEQQSLLNIDEGKIDFQLPDSDFLAKAEDAPIMGGGLGENKEMAVVYHSIKSLVHGMEEDSAPEVFERISKISSRKDLFAELSKHMKLDEKDSSQLAQASSEELKKNLISVGKKNQEKAVAFENLAKGIDDSVDDLSFMPEHSGSEEKNDKSLMESMLFRKIQGSVSKDTESVSSQDEAGAPISKKIMVENQVKKTPAQPKPLPVHVTRQVSKGVLKAIQNGENTLKLQLKPASLGRMLITIDNLGDSIKVSVMTENQAAKDILNGNASELKGILANTGINLEQFDVDMSSDFRQSMANNHQGFGSSGKRRSNSSGNNFDSTPEDLLASEDSHKTGKDKMSGSLHYVA